MADKNKQQTNNNTKPVVDEVLPVPEIDPATLATDVTDTAATDVTDTAATDVTDTAADTAATAPVEPVVVTETIVESTTSLTDQINASGTPAQRNLITALERYSVAMKPSKPISTKDGALQQYYLWKTISQLVESAADSEFNKLWNILLAYVEEQRDGVFGERYVYRFAEFWTWSETELTAFQRILNIIKLTSNFETRSIALKQVDLGRSLAEGFSDLARQRILTFYG